MEQFVFPRPAVAGELKHFVEARLHSDTLDPKLKTRIKELIDDLARSIAQPIYVALDPVTGRELARLEGAPLDSVNKFVEFLAKARRQVRVAAR